jgi:hypothetical protein
MGGLRRPRKADREAVDMAKMLLQEGMTPLDTGHELRDVGYNFPVTMDAIKRAKEELQSI